MIKKKLVIKGNKVQNIGYRPFLLDIADSELIPFFNARNERNGIEISVYVGGEMERIDSFVDFVKKGVEEEDNRPEGADIESIEVVDEDYKGNIRTTESYSRWLSNNQLYKMTKIGSTMLEKQDKMLEKQDETISEIKNIGSAMLEKQDETINEIRNLRNDFKSYLEDRFNKVEKDISKIKMILKIE